LISDRIFLGGDDGHATVVTLKDEINKRKTAAADVVARADITEAIEAIIVQIELYNADARMDEDNALKALNAMIESAGETVRASELNKILFDYLNENLNSEQVMEIISSKRFCDSIQSQTDDPELFADIQAPTSTIPAAPLIDLATPTDAELLADIQAPPTSTIPAAQLIDLATPTDAELLADSPGDIIIAPDQVATTIGTAESGLGTSMIKIYSPHIFYADKGSECSLNIAKYFGGCSQAYEVVQLTSTNDLVPTTITLIQGTIIKFPEASVKDKVSFKVSCKIDILLLNLSKLCYM